MKPNSIGFNDPASPVMEGIMDLHNYIIFYLTLIFIFVCLIFINIIWDFGFSFIFPRTVEELARRKDLITVNKITHNTLLELIWTLIPTVILIYIAVPSFVLLYAMDEIIQPSITIKAIGHQWYWSYEYSNVTANTIERINFDSNLVYEADLILGELRLLQTDKSLVLPVDTHINLIVTSNDVLHSFAIPSLGFKIDAVPGRLNNFPLFIKREGVFYGQCSELCGSGHGFMPITVRAVSFTEWSTWIKKNSSIV